MHKICRFVLSNIINNINMAASKILVPIGFSKQSIVALGQAFNLARIKKSDVVLLSVIEGFFIRLRRWASTRF